MVPAIFKVRIVTDKSGNKPVFLAYSMTASCVAQSVPRSEAEIVEIIERWSAFLSLLAISKAEADY